MQIGSKPWLEISFLCSIVAVVAVLASPATAAASEWKTKVICDNGALILDINTERSFAHPNWPGTDFALYQAVVHDPAAIATLRWSILATGAHYYEDTQSVVVPLYALSDIPGIAKPGSESPYLGDYESAAHGTWFLKLKNGAAQLTEDRGQEPERNNFVKFNNCHEL